jgi:ATP-binding cassette subfamily B (MDR/TAP) protein 1
VLFAVIIGGFSLTALGPRIETFAKASAAMQKIHQTLQRIPPIDSLSEAGERPDNVRGNIELKNVSFIYPARPEGEPHNPPQPPQSSYSSPPNACPPLHIFLFVCRSFLIKVIVLKHVNVQIPKDKFTAIVGPSGSGKSTVLQLLERFYDPVEGDILLDGHNIRDLNVKFLRSKMGLVSQEPVLFGTTVFQNVCHGYQTECFAFILIVE